MLVHLNGKSLLTGNALAADARGRLVRATLAEPSHYDNDVVDAVLVEWPIIGKCVVFTMEGESLYPLACVVRLDTFQRVVANLSPEIGNG